MQKMLLRVLLRVHHVNMFMCIRASRSARSGWKVLKNGAPKYLLIVHVDGGGDAHSPASRNQTRTVLTEENSERWCIYLYQGCYRTRFLLNIMIIEFEVSFVE